ncbi:MAG TPA: nitrate ABC transporter ATP-binding protein [Polyangiaceae bacterium]
MAYVELKGVSKRFVARDGRIFTALEDVGLEIEHGEFVSIIGHSGCGKSTVLNLVAGLSEPSGGTIRVAGEPVCGPGPERMVVFQNHSLLPWLTMRQNVALAVDEVHRKMSKQERSELVETHLAMVKLTAAAGRYPSQVSGGMKQRCGIARALSTRPKVLLLDEPFGALDALTRASLQDELVKIWERERITVVMITHDVDEALLLSDRIVMMSNGPAAKVADVMKVELGRPRARIGVINDPTYYRQRGELLYFLNRCKKEKRRKSAAVPPPAEIAVSGPAAASATGLEKRNLVVGFVPLLDCAPFAVAEAEKLFEQQGLKVTLSRETSWKAIAEGIREGRLDAAQMVAGMPIGETLGIGGKRPFPVRTAMVLSRGGNAITFGNGLRKAGVTDRASLRDYVARRRANSEKPLVFGIVHPASMHNLMLRSWLAAGGIDPDLDVTLAVIPPPQMVANLQQGNIAAYCVGEPWNARAVREGLGFVCATDTQIWADHPEKVLGVSDEWALRHPQTHVALIRALLHACVRCEQPQMREVELPALLAEPAYVGGNPADFRAVLSGPYVFGTGESRALPELVTFGKSGTNLCRTNESVWIAAQMARWGLTALPKQPIALVEEIHLESVLREAVQGTGIEVGVQSTSRLELDGEPPFEAASAFAYLSALPIRREIEVAPSERNPADSVQIDAA